MPPKAAKAQSTLEPPTLPAEGYCRLPLILATLAISKTTWVSGVKSGRFPAPVHLGRSVLWKVQDIRQVIADIEAGTLPQPERAPATDTKKPPRESSARQAQA